MTLPQALRGRYNAATGATVGDMFAGGGGWSLGATAAGCRVLWAIEQDPAIAAVYARNLGEHVICADIQTVDPHDLPPVPPLLAEALVRSML